MDPGSVSLRFNVRLLLHTALYLIYGESLFPNPGWITLNTGLVLAQAARC